MTYFLEISEGNDLIPCGNRLGYKTLAEAKADAIKHLDDALPSNTVHVVMRCGYASAANNDEEFYDDRELLQHEDAFNDLINACKRSFHSVDDVEMWTYLKEAIDKAEVIREKSTESEKD